MMTSLTRSVLPLVALSYALFLVGCSKDIPPSNVSLTEFSNHLLERVDTQSLAVEKNAHATLAEAAVSVSHSLHSLAEIERAVHPQLHLPPAPDAHHIGMADRATVDWTGPIGPLLKKVAMASHYTVRVLGNPPAIPIVISVTAKNTPLADILRDISFQAEKQANVVLYPHTRVIELRYLGA